MTRQTLVPVQVVRQGIGAAPTADQQLLVSQPNTTTRGLVLRRFDTDTYYPHLEVQNYNEAPYAIITWNGAYYCYSPTGNIAFNVAQLSDAAPRFYIETTAGYMYWGDGTAAVDTNLYRASANQLKTDDLFNAATDSIAIKTKAGVPVDGDFASTPPNGTIVWNTSTDTLYIRKAGTWTILTASASITYPLAPVLAAAGTDVLTSKVTGDAAVRFTLNTDGTLEWGDGTAALDVNLYRSQADYLKTDDQLVVMGGGAKGFRFYDDGNLHFAQATGATSHMYFAEGMNQIVWANTGAIATSQTSSLYVRDGAASQVTIGAMGPSSEAGVAFGTALDTVIYRSAANTLQTDDALILAQDANPQLTIRPTSASQDAGFALIPRAAGGGPGDGFILFANNAAHQLWFTTDVGEQCMLIHGPAGGRSVQIGSNGTPYSLSFGTDVYLFRNGASVLQTDSAFYSERANGSDVAFLTRRSAEGQGRFVITTDGLVSWGASGGVAPDTNLYRSAADTLKTDDSLVVGANFNNQNATMVASAAATAAWQAYA